MIRLESNMFRKSVGVFIFTNNAPNILLWYLIWEWPLKALDQKARPVYIESMGPVLVTVLLSHCWKNLYVYPSILWTPYTKVIFTRFQRYY